MISRFGPWAEKYSIDEAFLGLGPHLAASDLVAFGHEIRDTLWRLVGVPVCVGVGRTKTEAKLANKTAKKIDVFGGVCVWGSTRPEWRAQLMGRLPVSEVWGIAGRLEKRLAALGIHTIADLAAADPVMIRQKFNVVVARTALELRGVSCIPFEEERHGKEQLIVSRSFGEPVVSRDGMRQVLSVYAQMAAARLVKHHQAAKVLTAFAGTSNYAEQRSFPSTLVRLPGPTTDPVVIAKAAQQLLSQITDGTRYARAGIMLTDLQPVAGQQTLEPFRFAHEERGIATLLDEVQRRHGRDTVGLGLAGVRPGPAWRMKRQRLTPRATTHWDELAVVAAR